MKYKKYIVFSFDGTYPTGGMGDIHKDFDTIKEFKEYFDGTHGLEWDTEVVDRDTWEVVFQVLWLKEKDQKALEELMKTRD